MLEYIFIIIIGLCLGSFLNVCIYRLPKDQSLVKPRSHCVKCEKLIRWYDNIPAFSYLILKGKCRDCGVRISLRYPVVELLSAVFCLVLYLKFGLSLHFFQFLFFFLMLIVVSFIDIDYHAIPAVLCFLGILIGLILKLIPSIIQFNQGVWDFQRLPIVEAFKGLIVGLGFTYLFKFFGDIFIEIYLHWRKKESIEGETESLGLGDVDFMGMVGVFLGVKAAMLTFFIAPLFACLYSVFALFWKKSHLIPYLPYLSLAALTVFFWGNKIIAFFF